MIVGIDNGIAGGMCAVAPHGSIIAKTPMPLLVRKGKKEVNIEEFKEWIQALHTEPLIVIEEPLRHAKSSQAMRSMAINFGKLLGACEIKSWRTVAIDPKEWQAEILGRTVPKGRTKQAALLAVEELMPGENWTKRGRSKAPHDGMIDAYLIAEYSRRKFAL